MLRHCDQNATLVIITFSPLQHSLFLQIRHTLIPPSPPRRLPASDGEYRRQFTLLYMGDRNGNTWMDVMAGLWRVVEPPVMCAVAYLFYQGLRTVSLYFDCHRRLILENTCAQVATMRNMQYSTANEY